jgi:hypothetical protein
MLNSDLELLFKYLLLFADVIVLFFTSVWNSKICFDSCNIGTYTTVGLCYSMPVALIKYPLPN